MMRYDVMGLGAMRFDVIKCNVLWWLEQYSTINPAQGSQGATAATAGTWVAPDRRVHVAGVGTAGAVAKSCQGPSTAGYSAVPCPGLRAKTSTAMEV